MERKMMKFGEMLSCCRSVYPSVLSFAILGLVIIPFAGPVIGGQVGASASGGNNTYLILFNHVMQLYAPVYHYMYNTTNHRPSL